MARAAITHTWNASTIAAYKTSLQPISDAFRSLFTQTTDTGQVVWATVSSLPAANGIRDYEVFRFNDTAQATAPIFFRVDYGYENSAPATPWIQITVGSATDGAATLSGVSVARVQLVAATAVGLASTTATLSSYLSTDGSHVSFVACLNTTASTVDNWFGFILERFRNTDGTPGTDGWNFWPFVLRTAQNTFFSGNYTRLYALTTQPTVDVNPPVMIPGIVNTATFFVGSTEYAFPFITWGPTWRGASQGLLYGIITDYPRDAQINITHYGKTAQFIALGNSANLALPYSSSSTANTPLMKTGFTPLFRFE